jgi:hypothetical protein
MTQLPAHHSAESIKKLFQEWPHAEPDQIVDKSFFAKLGYKGDTPTEHVALLRALGFINFIGYRTPTWESYNRGDKYAVLRREIKRLFAPLYRQYPDAHHQSGAVIRNWAQAETGVSNATAQRIERTFRTLCGIAQFEQKNTYMDDGDFASKKFFIGFPMSALKDPEFLSMVEKYSG